MAAKKKINETKVTKPAEKVAPPVIVSVTARIRSAAETLRDKPMDEVERKMFYEKAHKGKKVVQLAAEMKSTEDAITYIDELHKYLQAEYDVLRMRLIPDQIENEGLVSPVNVAGIGKIVISPDVQVSIKSGEQPQLFAWLRKRKLGDLIQDTLNSSTLKAFVKSRILKGQEIPKDFLNVTPLERASIRKG